PAQPLAVVKPMTELADDSLGARRFAMALLATFAAVALVLAAIGLYSVMSYVVAQRTHEIGIRMALGARAADVQRLVVKQGMKLSLFGFAIGLGGSFALTRVMAAILYGVHPTDPITMVAVGAVLALAAAIASWLPARRATRVDPMIALRQE